MNVDRFVGDVLNLEYELHHFASMFLDKGKIENVIKQFRDFNPEGADLMEQYYEKLGLKGGSVLISQKELGNKILDIVSKAMPHLKIKSKYNYLERIKSAADKARETGKTKDFEKLVMSGEFDPSFALAVLACMESMISVNLIKICLHAGAKISDDNKKTINNLLLYKGNSINDIELVSLLSKAGYDFRRDWSIESHAMINPSRLFPVLAFCGIDVSEHPIAAKILALRERMLQEMMKFPPPGQKVDPQNLTVEQNVELALICQEKYQENRKQFVKASQNGQFEQAQKLFAEGFIEIDEDLVLDDRGVKVPLLVDACAKGDVRLAGWLLKSGANPNIFKDNTLKIVYHPPIITAAFYPQNPNRDVIIDLLLKAGAEVNIGPYILGGNYYHRNPKVKITEAFITHLSETSNIQEVFKYLIKSGLDISRYERMLWEDFDQCKSYKDPLKRAMLFYGYNSLYHDIQPFRIREYESYKIENKIREHIIKEMFPEGTLDKLESLSNAERIQLAELCYPIFNIVAPIYSSKDPCKTLRTLLEKGKIDLKIHGRHLFAIFDNNTDIQRDLIFYGVTPPKKALKLHFRNLELRDAMRGEMLLKRIKKTMLDLEALKKMSRDLVNLIGDYTRHSTKELQLANPESPESQAFWEDALERLRPDELSIIREYVPSIDALLDTTDLPIAERLELADRCHKKLRMKDER